MEVRPGYKQTEVGVIPENWEVGAISSIVASPIQNGVFNEPSRKGRGCKLINVVDLYSAVPIETSDLETFDATKDEVSRFGVSHGDIFFTRSSLTVDGIAHCNVHSRTSDEVIVFDCHIIRVRSNYQKADPFFLARYCTSRPARRYLTTNAKTTTMTTIDQGVIAKMPVPLPPVIEQRAIATALSDVDALLAKLDELIAKKRDLKQAAMQQLLTGQTRLPGFSAEWEVVKAGDIGQFRGGSGFPIKFQGATSGAFPLFKVSDMNIEGNETFMKTSNNYISEELRKQLGATAFPAESIVFAKVGAAVFLERKKILVKASCLDNNMAAYVLDAGRAYSRFVHYLLLNTKLGNLVSTTALPSLSGTVLAGLEMLLPPIPEQTAIATVLSDMDAELAALEARRDKSRALKQGMMQELLTGRIRLV